MATYFVILAAIGFGVGYLKKDKKTTLGILVGIAVVWGITHQAIWGFVALGELFLGYYVFDLVEDGKSLEKSGRDKNE
jgi:hypothetical protein